MKSPYEEQALVKPEMLKWARERAGLSIDEAEQIVGWPHALTSIRQAEAGTPIILQMLRRMSNEYQIPLAMFYLPEPPPDTIKVLKISDPTGNLASGYAYDMEELASIIECYMGECWEDYDPGTVALHISVENMLFDKFRKLPPMDEVL